MANNDRELTLILKADGSLGVKGLREFADGVRGVGGASDDAGDKLRKTGQSAEDLGKAFGIAATKGLNEYLESLKKTGEESGRAGKSARGLQDIMRSTWTEINQSIEVFNRVKRAVAWGYEFAAAGAAASELRETYSALMISVGQDPKQALESMRRATRGMVSELDLMKNATNALDKKATDDPADVAQLLKISEALSDLSGGTKKAQDVFDALIESISKGTPRALLEFGLLPESMKRVSDGGELLLTRQEMLNVIFDQAAEKLFLVGEAGGSVADKIEQLETDATNIVNAMREDMLPLLKEFVDYARRDIIPVVEGIAIVFRNWALATDSETAALARLADKGVAQQIAVKQKELDEIKAHLNNRRNNDEVDFLIEMRNRAAALEMEINVLARKGKKVNAAEIKDDDFKRNMAGWEAELRDRERLQTEKIEEARKAAEKRMREQASSAKAEAKRDAAEAEKWNKKALEYYFGDKGIGAGMGGLVDDAVGLASSVDLVTVAFKNMKKAEAQAVSELKNTLKERSEAAEVLIDGYVQSSGSINPQLKYANPQLDFLSSIPGIFGVGGRVKSLDQSTIDERIRKDNEAALEEFSAKLRINVGGAFEEGLYDAIKSGSIEDFGKAFGDSIRSQLASALSAGITASVFGIGNNAGTFSVAPLFGGGGNMGMTTGFNPFTVLSAAGGVPAASAAGSPAGSSSGLLGGLMGKLFKPVFSKAGNLQWGALGANLLTAGAIGFGVNRLFGEGGLFGGRVIHGQEQVQLSGDTNTQVGQASKQRDELISSLVGVSASTMQALKDMTFSYTSVVGHKSGNGIWSKKTTTYEAVGVAEAQASLAKFTELSQKATAEAAARQFEIALKQITSPLEALNMTISDLRDAVSRATDEQKQQLDYELKQALAQKEQMLSQYQANWFSTRLGTAAASAGTISAPPMESMVSGTVPNGIRANLVAGQPNHLVQLGLLEKQAKLDYSLAKKGLTANESEAALEAYLQERLEMNSRALKTYSALMEKARADAIAAKENTAAAELALQEFVQAQNAYYTADLEGLQIKQQLQAEIKAKQEAQKNDRILDALTWVGEQTKKGGVEVLILSPGQASTEERLVAIRNNADPAGAKVINQIIEANRTVTRRR